MVIANVSAKKLPTRFISSSYLDEVIWRELEANGTLSGCMTSFASAGTRQDTLSSLNASALSRHLTFAGRSDMNAEAQNNV
jgi:hypothetical protein